MVIAALGSVSGGADFTVIGSFRSRGGATHRVATSVAPSIAAARRWLVGGEDGTLALLTDPPDPDTGPALLARIDTPGSRYRFAAHNAMLTLPPPVDDPEAQARARRFRQAGQVPGIHTRVGVSNEAWPARRDLRSDSRWDAATRTLRITSSEQSFEDARLDDGVVYIGAIGVRDIAFRNMLFRLPPSSRVAPIQTSGGSLRPAALAGLSEPQQDAALAASRAGLPGLIVIEDTTFDVPGAIGSISTPRAVLHYGQLHMVRVESRGSQATVEHFGVGSLFEDLWIHDVGVGVGTDPHGPDAADDHGNGIICQAWLPHCWRLPSGRLSGGFARWNRLHIDHPAPPSARHPGGGSTAAISFWGSQHGLDYRGDVFTGGLVNGGTFCVDINPWAASGFVGDISFQDVAFGREYFYPGNAHPLFNVRNVPPSGGWGNIVFRGCFWADTGRLIDDLNGVWNPVNNVPTRMAFH